MTESEMKSLLTFGSTRGRSYGTVDRRYLGASLETKNFANYTVEPRKSPFSCHSHMCSSTHLDDTLTSIAVQYSISVQVLKRTNKMYLTCDSIEPGKLNV